MATGLSCLRALISVGRARGIAQHRSSLSFSSVWDSRRGAVLQFQLSKGKWVLGKRWDGDTCCQRIQVLALSTSTLESNQAIFYADAGINRAAEMRGDATRLSHAFSSPEALVVPLLGSKSLIKGGKPVLIPASTLPRKEEDEPSAGDPIFLGLTNSNQVPVFAVNVKDLCSTDGKRQAWEQDTEWVDVRRYGPQLQASEAGLLAYARGMVEWQSRNCLAQAKIEETEFGVAVLTTLWEKYCGHCGMRMVARDGGHSLNCSSPSCGTAAYPRLDPAVIMLVTSGNYVLLGRQGKWEPGRYSLLAGFVEIGETFEMAVVREVKEESGINVDLTSISYAASQPWPFPSSLMVGFTATAVRNPSESYLAIAERCDIIAVGFEKLAVVNEVNSLPRAAADCKELEDARWIHKDLLRWVLSGKPLPHGVALNVPGKYAIAHILMEQWISSSIEAPWAGDAVATVEIDHGVFKYVLICLKDSSGHEKLLVRGDARLGYHSDILEATHKQVQDLGLQVEVLGGGRIEHDSEQLKLHVFSISQAYGQADHTVTCSLLRQWFPFHGITLSWEG